MKFTILFKTSYRT